MAADGLVNRGNTYKEIGRVNEAVQDYMRAIAIRPTMAEAHANLASAYKDRYVVKFTSFKQLTVPFVCALLVRDALVNCVVAMLKQL